MIYKRLLVVRADGATRIVNTPHRARLGADEVAYPLTINLPDAWGKVDRNREITVQMPDPPEVEHLQAVPDP